MYRHNIHSKKDAGSLVLSIRVSGTKANKFKMQLSSDMTAEDLVKFIKDSVEGNNENSRFLSSLPVPPEEVNTKMDVRVVVASTWDKEVIEASKTKDVLVLQYATWCRGSKWAVSLF